ncbi:uncharacterized protein M421DRAFT_259560, partial [Didymella exigua CBS 183.55]
HVVTFSDSLQTKSRLNRNASESPFLHLPPELRNRIYSYVSTSITLPVCKPFGRWGSS